MITDIQPNISFKSSPKVVFLEMISFELRLEKWYEKTQKPLWFLGFPNRYLFRFAMLVGSAGLDLCLCDGHLQSSILRIYPFAVPDKIFGLTLFLDFIDRGTQIPCTASAAGSVQGI